jgi:hypothetical protein
MKQEPLFSKLKKRKNSIDRKIFIYRITTISKASSQKQKKCITLTRVLVHTNRILTQCIHEHRVVGVNRNKPSSHKLFAVMMIFDVADVIRTPLAIKHSTPISLVNLPCGCLSLMKGFVRALVGVLAKQSTSQWAQLCARQLLV